MNKSEDAPTGGSLSLKNQLIIFFLAAGVRIGFLLTQIHQKSYVGSDTGLYLEIARNILKGNGFTTNHGPTAFVSPLYPLFLSGSLSLFGENLIWTSLLQCVLAAVACVFIARTADLLFGRVAGLAAGIIAALYFELIMWASALLITEPLYVFFLSIAAYYLAAALTAAQNKFLLFSAAGCFFGLAGLVRPLALPTAMAICFLLLIASLWRKRAKQAAYASVFIAACTVVMLPWGVRNYLTLNHFTLLSTEGGHVFWLGNNPEYDRFEHPDFARFGGYTVMFNSFPPEVRGKTEVEASKIFYQTAWRHIFENPLDFIVRGFHKTWNMWRPTFSGSSRRNLLVSWTLYPLLLLSSIIGIFLSLKPGNGWTEKLYLAAPVWAVLVSFAIHFLITGEIRFRVPLWIFLIPFSALTFTLIVERLIPFRAAPKGVQV